jgi:hypothetical protein
MELPEGFEHVGTIDVETGSVLICDPRYAEGAPSSTSATALALW